jgi:rRNA processing protein Krr1/Pno1
MSKGKPAPVTKAPEPISDSDDDDIFFRGPIAAQIDNKLPSKSAARRARAKENKKQEAAYSGKPIIDDDGFQTHIIKRRPRKTEAQKAAAAAPQQSRTDAVPGEKQISVEMEISPRHYGLLIGPKGETLKKIQEACEVRIDIPDRESDKTTVTVMGTKDNVKKAQKNIDSLINKGFSAVTDPGINSSSISCPGKALGIVIGPGGSNIKKLQAATNCKINTPDRASGSDKVTISGEKKDVKACKEAIKMLIEHGFSSITHPDWTMIVVPFPVDDLRLLIGPGGHTIKSIQGDSKAKINVPDRKIPGTTCDLTIVGTVAGCDKAKKQIAKILDKKDMEPVDPYAMTDPYDDPDYDSQEEYFR